MDIYNQLKNADTDYYFNGKSKLNDYEYDKLLKEYNDTHIEDYKPYYRNYIGKLPIHMGSINKIKHDNMNKKSINERLNKWKSFTNEYIISSKLDGVSALLSINEHNDMKLYNRNGKNITWILDYIKLPKIIKCSLMYRGELIIKKSIFNGMNNKLDKNNKYKNARNFVSGLLNTNKDNIDKNQLKLVDFVLYEIIDTKLKNQIKPINQFKSLNNFMFLTPIYNIINSNDICEKYLNDHLNKNINLSQYDIDGIVIIKNIQYNRDDIDIKGNPKYSIAYKVDKPGKETYVIDIIWTNQKNGRIVPTILFEEIQFKDSIVKKVNGNNGKFIIDNMINKGSKILITMGGEIIPKLIDVIENTSTYSKPIKYTSFDGVNYWGDINIEKRLLYFVKNIGIKGIGKKQIKLLYDNDIDTIEKLIHVKEDQIKNIKGFGKKTINIIVNDIKNSLLNINHSILASSICIFGTGIGKKTLDSFFKCDDWDIMTYEQIKNIKGIGEKTSKSIYNNISKYKTFIINNNLNFNI